MKKCPTQPILVRNCVVAFLEQEIYMNCFQWRILWGDFGRQPSSEAHNRGCSGGNWGGEGPGFWGCTVLLCLADEIFFVNDGDQGSPSCVKQECSRVIYFLGKLGRGRLPYDVMVPWEMPGRALLFCCCCFPPPKEKPTRAGAVGEPPGTKTITKTKRREIWMSLWILIIDFWWQIRCSCLLSSFKQTTRI